VGIFNKVITARRTKSDLVALPQDKGDLRDALEASIREAACAVGTGRTFSVTSRGWSSPLVDAFRAKEASVWVTTEQEGMSVAMGVQLTTGRVHDWVVTARYETATDGTGCIRVDTPERATRDGKLMNAKAHDDIRDAFRDLPDFTNKGSAQAQVTEAGLRGIVSPITYSPDLEALAGRTIRTSLSAAEVIHELKALPLPLLSASESEWTWGLSVLSPDGRNTFNIALHDRGGYRALVMNLQLKRTEDLFTDTSLTRMRFMPQSTVLDLLRAADPDAKYEETNGQ
jgi:hypothetical protein